MYILTKCIPRGSVIETIALFGGRGRGDIKYLPLQEEN